MSYDLLGPVYDQDSHIEVTKGFYSAIVSLLPALKGTMLMDLGCGTGLLTVRLAARGFRVMAIDRSTGMIEVARKRCARFGSRVRFASRDLRAVGRLGVAGGAFACGDVVNHFGSEAALGEFFCNVRKLLAPGGIFVFDALNRWCFREYWRERTYYFTGPNGDIVMDCEWDPRERVGTARMSVFSKGHDGRFDRRRFTLRERWFAVGTMEKLLRRAGFSRINHRDWSPWPDQHLEESLDRTLWRCERE